MPQKPPVTSNACTQSVAAVGTPLASTPRTRASCRKEWRRSFLKLDPRRQIVNFFRPGDERGPLGHLRAKGLTPRGKSSSFFAVWRPTSFSALSMMILGEATGKGLNIKGKSAKRGVLSGFVPFLQISEESHKSRVSRPLHPTPPALTRLPTSPPPAESTAESTAESACPAMAGEHVLQGRAYAGLLHYRCCAR